MCSLQDGITFEPSRTRALALGTQPFVVTEHDTVRRRALPDDPFAVLDHFRGRCTPEEVPLKL